MIRRGNNLLQVCKQMAALSGGAKEANEKVDLMRRVMGVMQHHDAVTGTAKQAVTFDYQERLAKGFDMCESVVEAAFKVVQVNFTLDICHPFRPVFQGSRPLTYVTSLSNFSKDWINPIARVLYRAFLCKIQMDHPP